MRKRGFAAIELAVVIAITGILASMSLPLLKASERSRQIKCRNNLIKIHRAMVQYANDYNDYVVPLINWDTSPPKTWQMLLEPYVHGGKGTYYATGPGDSYTPKLFYCPTRLAQTHQMNMNGYYTNYGANYRVMRAIDRKPTWPPPGGGGGPTDWHFVLTRWNDFVRKERIIMLFEGKENVHVCENLENFWYPDTETTDRNVVDFPHNSQTHMLRMSGAVSALPEEFPLDVWLTDEGPGTY